MSVEMNGEVTAKGGEALHVGEKNGLNNELSPFVRNTAHLKSNYTQSEIIEILRAVGYDFNNELSKLEFSRVMYKIFRLDAYSNSILINRLFDVFDHNRDGVIDYEEYITGSSVITRGTHEERSYFIFKLFDADSDGFITKEEFKSIFTWTNKYAQRHLFDIVIDENNAHVDFEEFVHTFFQHSDKSDRMNVEQYRTVAKQYSIPDDHPHSCWRQNMLLETQTKNGKIIGRFMYMPCEKKLLKYTSKNEIEVYRSLEHKYPFLIPFVPKCYGIAQCHGSDLVIMEDLKSRFSKPSIMDLKMGISTAGRGTSRKQKAADKDKLTTSAVIGFRIVSIQTWNVQKSDYEAYSKTWGKNVVHTSMLDSIRKYFFNGNELRQDVITDLMAQMQEILRWAEKQNQVYLVSSSLLFMYEGNTAVSGGAPPILKIIDFEHLRDITDGSTDDGFLVGVRNLYNYLETLKTQQ